MKNTVIILVLIITSSLAALEKTRVSIFYKEKPPSQQVLVRVDSILAEYTEACQVNYFNIEDPASAVEIKKLGLPQTHFPFAIAVNDKFTAEISGKTVSFVHFPLFMHGIGRHEGNWSLPDLQMVLEDNTLLSQDNILPVLDAENETSECEE